jgi:hypothetical protein
MKEDIWGSHADDCGMWHRIIWYETINTLEEHAAMNSEEGNTEFLRNVSKYLPNYTA